METSLIFTAKDVVKTTVMGSQQQQTHKDLKEVFEKFSSVSVFDTGLLPCPGNGLITYRKALGHEQIVYQIAPSKQRIIWGAYEGDKQAGEYYVAQPYRIVIGDYNNGTFIGARHFYSPVPITSPDLPLYHVNLPNLNCVGYPYLKPINKGVGVGWMCLYPSKKDESKFTLAEKVHRLLRRASGDEAYNDQNMSETDGPRFYKKQKNNNPKLSFLWDPHKWQSKTEKEGVDWVLDPDLWIPVLVTDIDSQDRHVPNGKPLTYGMALTGFYRSYYQDPWENLGNKPINVLVRGQELDPSVVFVDLMKATNSAKTISQETEKTQPVPTVSNLKTVTQNDGDPFVFKCYVCKTTKDAKHGVYVNQVAQTGPQAGEYIKTPVCVLCAKMHFVCANCGQYNHLNKTTTKLVDGLYRRVCKDDTACNSVMQH